MVLVPYEQYQRVIEVQTNKIKDQKPMMKMVAPVAQATEMAMAEIKRECDAVNQRKA